MKEIGGYFGFEFQYSGREFHEDAVHLNLARNALLYLLETKKYRKIYIPFFLCDCIKKLAEKHKIEIGYYRLDKNIKPLFEGTLQKNEAIWIVNYYGQLTTEEICNYKEKWNNIILDNTHDFFTLPVSNVDTVYNARKYFGVTDGGYLYTDIPLRRTLEPFYSYNRVKHIVGRFEKTAGEFYSEFVRQEQELDSADLKEMSPFSANILHGVDYQSVKQIRESNFSYLASRLNIYNCWILREQPGTYMYPFWCAKGAHLLRKKLIEKKIYVSVLWPNVLEDVPSDSLEYQMAENIIPLPIDQRYDQKDMEYMCDTVIELYSQYAK